MDQSQLFEIKLELEGKRGVVYEPEILRVKVDFVQSAIL